jgi:hypothetical protein
LTPPQLFLTNRASRNVQFNLLAAYGNLVWIPYSCTDR